jgi:hypothetical protein
MGALGAAALLSAAALLEAGGANTTLMPGSDLGIASRHATHVEAMGMACSECHAGAASSHRADDLLVPSNDVCAPCHPEAVCISASPDEECARCHETQPRSLLTARFRHAKATGIRFDHAAHAPPVVPGCEACHPLHPVSPDVHAPALPTMEQCISCHPHDAAWAVDLCSPCHLHAKNGKLVLDTPGGPLTPEGWMHAAAHDDLWVTGHAPTASNHPGFCAACHTDGDCASCHAGHVKPASIHPGDWIQFHPVAASLGRLRCTSCHDLQHDCITCHRKAGVAWDSPITLGIPAGDVFHPPGWTSLDGGSGHAVQARKNLAACVSCHTESDCITCHSASAMIPVSPHPPASTWLGKCKTMAGKNPASCLKCHDAVPAICR